MPDKRKYADRRESLIKAVSKRRRKVKTMSIEYKGGKCLLCGYNRFQGALELHHIDSEKKEFGIGDKGYTRSWEKVRAELDKCVLLCANCHREVGAGIQQLPKEILVDKRGEFGETPTHKNRVGNTEPSKQL
jgi:5-methylcytosine-specific restriction endonuclease McrA